MITFISLTLLGLLYYAMPIYYNQVRKQELKDDYMRVAMQLDGKPEVEILEEIDDYDQKLRISSLLYSPSQIKLSIQIPMTKRPKERGGVFKERKFR